MRIGIDVRMYSSKFTGIGRYNFELVKHLLKLQSEHTFVLFLNEPEYSKYSFKEPNVEKVLVDARHYSFGEQTRFLKKVHQANVDLMHFTNFNSPILYFGKQVVTIHDLTILFFPGKKKTSLVHRLAYNLTLRSSLMKAKKVIAVSENTKKDIIKATRIPEKNIEVIYEGASDSFYIIEDESTLQSIRDKYNLHKPFLLYTGVWRNHKNVVGLIAAFKKIREKHNLDIDLVITGKPDPLYHEVEDTILALDLNAHVKRVGLVPENDLVALYNLASLYVFPSFYEGFGIPPLEAFSVNLPVACSITSCLPEVCGEENAVFFDPYDTDDMAEKITQLYNDKDLQKSLQDKGKKRLEFFSWKKMAEQTYNLYLEVLK